MWDMSLLCYSLPSHTPHPPHRVKINQLKKKKMHGNWKGAQLANPGRSSHSPATRPGAALPAGDTETGDERGQQDSVSWRWTVNKSTNYKVVISALEGAQGQVGNGELL